MADLVVPWYANRTQQQKILLTAAASKLSGTEWAVLTVLLQQPDYRLAHVSDLWDGRLLPYKKRIIWKVLPYTRQGIDKAVRALHARGWLKVARGRWHGFKSKDSAVQLLPLNILSEAPEYLRPRETDVDDAGSDNKRSSTSRLTGRNKCSSRPGSTNVAKRSTRSREAAKAQPDPYRTDSPEDWVHRKLIVRVTREAAPKPSKFAVYRCGAGGGEGPPGYYHTSEYSMPGAARSYAAKVFTRLTDVAVQHGDLQPSNPSKGRYEYTLRPKARARVLERLAGEVSDA